MRFELQRGLDLALPGKPEQVVDDAHATVSEVALLGLDYAVTRPVLAVSEGDTVRLGQTLFTDRRDPAIRFTAPAAGRIASVLRGRRRRLLKIGIAVDAASEEPKRYRSYARDELTELDVPTVRERLLGSGLWTAFRTRPFDAIPTSESVPRAILVTAIDTNPLAADPAVVIAAQHQSFACGLAVLARLCARVVLCTRPGAIDAPELPPGIELAEFGGPHPAGLVGTHLHALDTQALATDIWHIGYQDVIAVGALFGDGEIMTQRIVALGGSGVARPRLLRTRLGACLRELVRGETDADGTLISGSVLAGRRSDANVHHLGRYDTQVTVLGEPAGGNASWATRADTPASGMLSVEAFERIWPFAVPPLPLLRALLTRDVELMRKLGGLKLAAEDLALCSFVCPANNDYGAALDATLARYREEL